MKTINEERLFKLLPHFFERPEGALIELAQNAVRAGATHLDITIDGNTLEVTDNGAGISEAAPVFTLADSAWSEKIETNENPAGWGLYVLFCISERVYIRSGFGSIEVDCNRLLQEKEYRKGILDNIKDNSSPGLYLKATLRPEINIDPDSHRDKLNYFPLEITINNVSVERRKVEDDYDYPLIAEYMGNKVYINPYASFSFPEDMSFPFTVWYGIKIPGHLSRRAAVVIDVKCNNPLTPVLPYRHSIKCDKKLKAFQEFARKTTANYCIERINSSGSVRQALHHNGTGQAHDKDETLIKIMKTMERIATQSELERLERFFVRKHQPYFDDDFWSNTGKDLIVKKGEEVVSESASVMIEGEEVDGVFLPEGTIWSIKYPSRYPCWLKDQVKTVTHKVLVEKKSAYEGYFRWYSASVKSDKPIKVLAVASCYDDLEIYYANKPGDFYDISDAVFAGAIYYEDGDTYDTQEYYFKEDLGKDLQKLEETYDLGDLFKGMEIANIYPYNIKEISVKDKSIVVKLKDDKERTLNVR